MSGVDPQGFTGTDWLEFLNGQSRKDERDILSWVFQLPWADIAKIKCKRRSRNREVTEQILAFAKVVSDYQMHQQRRVREMQAVAAGERQ
jgi:hypothetical protein